MLLKFNSIKDLSDARYAAAAMAEWIGFSVGKEDSLSAAKIQEIIGWCAGPQLVLEIPEGFSAEKLQVFLDVLPVDGIEIPGDAWDIYKNMPGIENLQVIFKGDQAPSDPTPHYTHSEILQQGEKHILRVIPGTTDPVELLKDAPTAISIDCHPATEPALKNYDEITGFLEALGMF